MTAHPSNLLIVTNGDSAGSTIRAEPRWPYRPSKPALTVMGGDPFRFPPSTTSPTDFRDQRIQLTALGHALLEGATDWIDANGIDRWLGGVHLRGDAVWRWHTDDQRLISPFP